MARWYASAVASATARQLNSSRARSRPAAPISGSPLGVVEQRLEGCLELADVAGRSRRRRTGRVGPTTSGIAPARLTTNGVPHAIASTVGSEKPSYSDGTQAISADPTTAASSSSEMPLTKRTESVIASRSMRRSVCPPGFGRLISSSSTSRSVRSFANASSRVAMPFIGMSALAIATIRPGTRGAGGENTWSTPSGITWMRAGSTPKSATTSRAELSDGHSTCEDARATLPCIRRKPYQRRSDRRCFQLVALARSTRRSKVIGWWIVVTTGRPARSMSSTP